MSKYAAGTTVSAAKSRAEIEDTVVRYGASGFVVGHDADRAVVGFKIMDRMVRFTIIVPDRADFAMSNHKPPRERTVDEQTRAWEQATRQLWRALALCIKAKLEAVESGIVEFDEEFMAHIVTPDGRTIGDHIRPKIGQMIEGGKMPPLLPDYSS